VVCRPGRTIAAGQERSRIAAGRRGAVSALRPPNRNQGIIARENGSVIDKVKRPPGWFAARMTAAAAVVGCATIL